MSIPKKYDKRMRQSWGMHAVWLPGSAINAGDIVQMRSPGDLALVGNLKDDFDITFSSRQSEGLKAGFKSASTKIKYFQGGAEVSANRLSLGANASVEFSFSGSDSFFVSTPVGKVTTLENLIRIGDRLTNVTSWRHDRYFIVREVFDADGFTVLGSEQANRKATFTGDANALIKFVTLGLSAGVNKTSSTNLDVEFIGGTGALGIELARVKQNGLIVPR